MSSSGQALETLELILLRRGSERAESGTEKEKKLQS